MWGIKGRHSRPHQSRPPVHNLRLSGAVTLSTIPPQYRHNTVTIGLPLQYSRTTLVSIPALVAPLLRRFDAFTQSPAHNGALVAAHHHGGNYVRGVPFAGARRSHGRRGRMAGGVKLLSPALTMLISAPK
jgi:hypothetical protein